MINTTAKGSSKELASGRIFESEGCLVGSRRKIPGPGDWLIWSYDRGAELVEVKCGRSPYDNFRKADRLALREFARIHKAKASLAYWAPRARTHRLIPEAEWPD